MRNKLVDLLDLLRRKVLRQHQWIVIDPVTHKRRRIRVDAMPIEQFNYQRNAAAARLQSMKEVS